MKKISVFLFAFSILLFACNKKEGCIDNTACNFNADAEKDDGSCTYAETNFDCEGNFLAAVETGSLEIKIVPTYGDEVMEMKKAVQDENGLDILKLDGDFHFYLSNIKLIGANSTEPIEDEIVLVDLLDEKHNPAISTAKAGTYSAVEMGLGVDEKWNHSDPTSFENDHPLGDDHNSNVWTWETGYIFYMVEGFFSSKQDGNLDSTFTYHIGTDPLFKTITLQKEIVIEEGATNEIELRIDLKKILLDEGGMDLETEKDSRSGDTGNQFEIAQKFVNLIAETIE